MEPSRPEETSGKHRDVFFSPLRCCGINDFNAISVFMACVMCRHSKYQGNGFLAGTREEIRKHWFGKTISNPASRTTPPPRPQPLS